MIFSKQNHSVEINKQNTQSGNNHGFNGPPLSNCQHGLRYACAS